VFNGFAILAREYPPAEWVVKWFNDTAGARLAAAAIVGGFQQVAMVLLISPPVIEAVRSINAFGIGDCFPDRTLVLALAEGGARARARDNEESDRIGGRPEGYHQKVDLAFRLIAAEEPQRVKLVDASGTAAEVTERLLDALEDLLP